MTTYHNYLVTSLDLHMVNLDEFKYGGTNVTILLELVQFDHVEVEGSDEVVVVRACPYPLRR